MTWIINKLQLEICSQASKESPKYFQGATAKTNPSDKQHKKEKKQNLRNPMK